MPIEFRCIGCEKLLRTGDHTGGMPAKCPECGALQPIPEYGSELDIAPKPRAGRREPGWQSHNSSSFATDEDSAAAVVSLLLGVTALMTSCCLPLAFPVALIGLVMGIRALRSKHRVLALVGTVLSFLGIMSTFGMTIALLFGF